MDARRFLLVAAGGLAAVLLAQAVLSGDGPGFGAGRDPVAAACDLGPTLLKRIARGYSPAHSEDIIIVPAAPNYVGSFELNSHTGPWNYVQRVPLVLYGPRFVARRGRSSDRADLTDVFPTVGKLLGVDLPQRNGRPLRHALRQKGAGRPKMIVVLVWDGAGRNVLRRWRDRWPNLKQMGRRGISYSGATVGSSPSITPATHSTLGTGAWPRSHGVTAIQMRSELGLQESFSDYDPRDLKLSTFADEIDRSFGNRSLVGLIAWQSWHLGMLGRGSDAPGGDADLVGVIRRDQKIEGNSSFYETPPYLGASLGLLRDRAEQLDRADGRVDDEWLGHEILPVHQSPAWIHFETDLILKVWEREGFGNDAIPDLFFANYKMTDIAGHQFAMDSREMAQDLAAQDADLGRLLEYLERNVRDYVVIVTADHGHTPPADKTGAWPIDIDEVARDLNRHFGISAGESLVQRTHAVGLFVDRDVTGDSGVSLEEMAAWLNRYTIRENWTKEELPAGYENRGAEEVFSAVFPGDALPAVLRCARDKAS
jgi:hypothetical protein